MIHATQAEMWKFGKSMFELFEEYVDKYGYDADGAREQAIADTIEGYYASTPDMAPLAVEPVIAETRPDDDSEYITILLPCCERGFTRVHSGLVPFRPALMCYKCHEFYRLVKIENGVAELAAYETK